MKYPNRRQFQTTMATKTTMAALMASGLANSAFADDKKQKMKSDLKTKKGICGKGFRCGAVNASWYYHWVPTPSKKFEGQDEIEFVPMFKGGIDVTQKNLDSVESFKTSHNVTHLLGFNEPDNKTQGNVSVDKAIKLWPKLMDLDLRLGSPGVTDNAAGRAWFKQFAEKAKQRKLKYDFICMHFYPNYRNEKSVDKVIQRIETMYKTYQLPIWITEFSLLNFGSKDRKMTAADNFRFMQLILPKLNRLPYLERYCWFSSDIAAMFHGPPEENNLTKLGQLFKKTA